MSPPSFREAFGVRRIPALWIGLSMKVLDWRNDVKKRRDTAHSKRFASSVAALPALECNAVSFQKLSFRVKCLACVRWFVCLYGDKGTKEYVAKLFQEMRVAGK